MKPRTRWLLIVICLVAGPRVGHAGLRETAHNLSPSGLGRRQAGGQGAAAALAANGQDDLCVFCHTPHNATGRRGLWSRQLEPVTYKLYQSSTMQARPQQPTGSSRLCLSCHDGMMAIDAPKGKGGMTLGRLTGPSVLGTDLSDDHPISFVYDQALVTRRRDLASPATLVGSVKLDDSGQVQCTSCHDAHLDRHPKFLVTDPSYSGLCVACHQLPHWQESAHATSSATARSASPLPGSGYATVSQNGCSSCHRSHGAQHPQRLLTATTEEGVCLPCHDGRVAAKDLRREFVKYSAHRVDMYTDVHDPIENPNTMARHVECVDCHNAHEVRARSVGGQIPGPLAGVSGVTISGSFVREASFEYEICLKCHGVNQDRDPVVFRTDSLSNVRLEIDPQNASFHPVADVGRNPNIPGLVAPLTPASRTPCLSCHNNDAASQIGSSAPRGPHGSNYRPILAAEYHLDATMGPESYQLYALCYRCHDRNTLLNRPDGFPHQLHVGKVGASCAVCHDAHGSRRNAHLINFMSRDLTGKVVVTASSSGQLEYTSLGMGTGRCFLTCHGSDHNSKDYPSRTLPAGAARQPGARGSIGR
ncbi:MAG: cytochrome c3 family protein [Candidatus Binatia bacterium]